MIATLLILVSVTFVAMMSPGPDMMLLLKYSGANKHWPAVVCIAGICSGVMVHVTLSILGIAAIIAASATLYSSLKFAGAAYLVYIGMRSLLTKGGLELDRTIKSKSAIRVNPFREGLLCNALNPKVTIFILAVFTQVVEPSTPVFDKSIYGLFIVLESFIVWNGFVMLIRTKLVLSFIQNNQVTIERIVGVALIGFGGVLALDETL